jgi:hypothetical protein
MIKKFNLIRSKVINNRPKEEPELLEQCFNPIENIISEIKK